MCILGSQNRLSMSALKNFPLFLLLILSLSTPALAKKSMFFANKIADFSQIEIDEESHGNGKAYCAPTAASNVFRWLHIDRVNQGALIKLLASPEYMNTDIGKGTLIQDFLDGIALYMNNFLDGYQSLKYQGMGYVEPQYATGIYTPDIDWITEGLGMKKATWLRLGFYKYDEEAKTYTRHDGHIVNLVGFNISPRDNILVIHDPASQPDKSIVNHFLDIHFLPDGVINYGKTSLPAQNQLFVENGKEFYPDVDVVILEGAIRLETY